MFVIGRGCPDEALRTGDRFTLVRAACVDADVIRSRTISRPRYTFVNVCRKQYSCIQFTERQQQFDHSYIRSSSYKVATDLDMFCHRPSTDNHQDTGSGTSRPYSRSDPDTAGCRVPPTPHTRQCHDTTDCHRTACSPRNTCTETSPTCFDSCVGTCLVVHTHRHLWHNSSAIMISYTAHLNSVLFYEMLKCANGRLPSQVRPSLDDKNPSLHSQRYDPGVFSH